MQTIRRQLIRLMALAVLLPALQARAADSLIWRAKQQTVDVNISDWDLQKLLKKIAADSGWHIYVERGTTANITAKFKDRDVDDALRSLLAKVNFAKSATNGVTNLLVFRTIPTAATERVQTPASDLSKKYRIPNELLVRLKSNSAESIEDIAKRLGATILGRNDALHLYRLQFADEAAASAAATDLNSDSSVALVDNNYIVDRPTPAQSDPVTGGRGASAGPSSLLNPKAPVDGRVIGLIDTAVQIPDSLKQFALTPINVVGQADLPTDQITHGTSMFETLLEGMPDAPSKILPVDIYSSGDSTTTYEVALGIIQAVNAGANPINLSLGGTGDSPMLRSLIDEGSAKGILFVAASGNTPGDATTFPAAYPGVLAITAADPNGHLASYADNGSFVKAMEPGTSIVYLNGQSWIVQGTSTATAFATAGITQLMNQQKLTLPQAITQFIQSHPPPPH